LPTTLIGLHISLVDVAYAVYPMRLALVNGNSEISVSLAGKVESIKFVSMHKRDLQSALGLLNQKT
jgi:hypothetical protein